MSNLVVTKLNGREILSLDDFAEAAKNPANGFHKIEFAEDPHEIYLDAKQVDEDAEQVQKVYSLPTLERL